jgi:hypothetical protein
MLGLLFITVEGGYRLHQEPKQKLNLGTGTYPEPIADILLNPREIGITVTNISGCTANKVGVTIDSHKWRIDFRTAPHLIVGERHPFIPYRYVYLPGMEYSGTERTARVNDFETHASGVY